MARSARSTWRRPSATALALGLSVGLVPVAAGAAVAPPSPAAADIPEPVVLEPDVSRYAYFGHTLSVSEDTLLVGAPSDDWPVNSAGSVRAYLAADGGWAEQALLVADDADKNDEFGYSVAVDGDTAAIGAAYAGVDGVYGTGKAYVFVRSGSTWTQQAELLPDGPPSYGHMGWSVAVQGDTVVIGAPDSAGRGEVYIFTRVGSEWTEQTVLDAFDLSGVRGFGRSLALDGDTLVVGAADGSDESAFVFVGAGATWTQQAVLTASDGTPGDDFGGAVDVDGNTVVVGAEFDTASGVDSAGSAYVYKRAGSTWTEQAHLLASDPNWFDRFGSAVTVAGKRIMIGAYEDSSGGGVYEFKRSHGVWEALREFGPANGGPSAVDLDKHPGGGRTVAVGDKWAGIGGMAYVYDW